MANEIDKKAKLQEAMSRAAKLMKLESNGTIDKIASDPSFRANIDTSLDGGVAINELMSTSRDRNTQAPQITRQMGENANNVPQAIREAFMNNPIDESDLYSAFGEQGDGRSLSFLTEGIKPKQEIVKPQNVRNIVNEGMVNAQPQMQTAQQIDYPMIRTIVEEIVRKYAFSLKNKILNENKQTNGINEVNTIVFGKTFKFLTENGDIYQCTMKKVSNINDMKKNKKGVIK